MKTIDALEVKPVPGRAEKGQSRPKRPVPTWNVHVPGEGVLKAVPGWTKGEARAVAKSMLKLRERLPAGSRCERVS